MRPCGPSTTTLSPAPSLWPGSPLVRLLLVPFLLTLGCGGKQGVDDRQVEPEVDVPGDFPPRATESPALDDAWCSDFGEPALGTFVEHAVASNFDFRLAMTRVQEAEALLAMARSQRQPRIGAESSAARGNALVPGLGGPELETRNTFGLSATAAWEADLWGRVATRVRAAEADRQALLLDLRALEMVIASRAAESWFQLARAREERRLLADQIETAEMLLELVESRFRHGLASALDVLQQRQNIEELRSREAPLELEEQLASRALARLSGEATTMANLPEIAQVPVVDGVDVDIVPADLLERRPDVAAARLRAVAADLRVDAALKDRLPRLRLSASLSLQATSVAELFDYLFWSLGASLSQSVFEGGRIRAEVERERAVAERALLDYTRTLLDAIHEVEESLARARARERAIGDLMEQLALAGAALDAARVRYRGGDVDFLRVLTAQQVVQRLEQAAIEARRAHLVEQVQLCRAAGGIPTPTARVASEEDR